MEIKYEPFLAVAKEIDRYMGTKKPDHALTAALLTATSPEELLAANDNRPALVAWVDGDERRHALAQLGQLLIKASVGGKRPEGFMGVRPPDSVSVYRRDDIKEVSFGGFTEPDVIGSDVGWEVRSWTVRLGHDLIWLSEDQVKATRSADRVTTFMLGLMPTE